MAQQVKNMAGIHEDVGSIPGFVHKMECRSQWQLGSGVAVACSCSSDLSPSLGPSMCHGCGPKKQNKQTKNKNKTPTNINLQLNNLH